MSQSKTTTEAGSKNLLLLASNNKSQSRSKVMDRRTSGNSHGTSNAELMKRKYYLMKLMLKNERKANGLISQQLGGLTAQLHMKNPVVINSFTHL